MKFPKKLLCGFAIVFIVIVQLLYSVSHHIYIESLDVKEISIGKYFEEYEYIEYKDFDEISNVLNKLNKISFYKTLKKTTLHQSPTLIMIVSKIDGVNIEIRIAGNIAIITYSSNSGTISNSYYISYFTSNKLINNNLF